MIAWLLEKIAFKVLESQNKALMMTRRQAIQQTVGAAATLAALGQVPSSFAAQPAASGPFQLPKLPYALDALEPHIDAKTMEIHHGKHHAAYIAQLNKAVIGKPALQGRTVEDLLLSLSSLPTDIQGAVRNHGGGHYNHSLFWQSMSRSGGGEPQGDLAAAIDKSFGSFASFRERFSEAALKQFGSGWAWLIWNGRQLEVRSLPNQDAALATGHTVLLGLDVWEHAYYLKYQNRRADYITAFFKVVDWGFVRDRFAHK